MNIGKIVAIAGPVVDVEFEEGKLPHIREALTVRINGERRVMEVAQQVGDNTVRCIMLAATEYLARGMEVAADAQGHQRARWAAMCWAGCSMCWAIPSTAARPCPQARNAGRSPQGPVLCRAKPVCGNSGNGH